MEQPVQQAIKAIREAVPNLLVIADVHAYVNIPLQVTAA